MSSTAPYRPIGNQLPAIRKAQTLEVMESKDGGNFGQGVPAFWFARAIEIGGSSQTLYKPFADSVWVSAAIKQVSGPISSVSVEVAAPAQSAALTQRRKCHWKAPGAKPVTDAAILDFLNEPSPGMGWEDFVQASVGYLKLSECFWILDESLAAPFPEVRGRIPKLMFARPDRMQPQIDNCKLVGWQYTPVSGLAEFLPNSQVIRLMNWNPYDDWRGLGEYQAASIAAEADWLAGKFARNLMSNNGDLGGVIVAKGQALTDPQREQVINQLREKRAAQLRGEMRYMFMTGDVDVKDPKIVSVDAPFISQRLENRHEIATAFGVPMSRFDIKASYSIGSASDYYQLIMDTCVPTGAKLCSALERVLAIATGRKLDVTLNWDEHPVMQEVRRERLSAMDGLFAKGMPVKVINDYLALELPEYEGWEIGYVPINLTQVGAPESEPLTQDDYSEAPPANLPEDAGDDSTPAPTKNLLKFLRSAIAQPAQLALPSPAVAKTPRFKALWESHMRRRSGSVKMFQSRASKVINEFRGIALKHLASARAASKSIVTKSLIDVIFDPNVFGATLAKGLSSIHEAVLQTAGDELFDEIGRPDDPWQMPPHQAQQFIKDRRKLVMNCGATVRSQLNTQLIEANENGETIEQITDRVRGVFNNCARFEARRIAMTETSAAYGFARHVAMTDAGIEYKAWVSSHGPNVREAHAEAEDETADEPVPVDQPFEVDGEQLMYPGDPSGSPGNLLNCQCIQIAVEKQEEDEEKTSWNYLGFGAVTKNK